MAGLRVFLLLKKYSQKYLCFNLFVHKRFCSFESQYHKELNKQNNVTAKQHITKERISSNTPV